MTTVRCPMPECRKRVDLDAIPRPPEQPSTPPCLHFIAAWGAGRGPAAEAVLWGLAGNREFQVRNLRPGEVRPERIEAFRAALDEVARRFAHEVASDAAGEGALFGDIHERNHVAREFAHLILGPDPIPPGLA
ncbi:MAG: hypothetical protein AMXMBFR23_03810 [Chloroflexota bacterium]